jgi:hypothetical protein
VPWGTSRGIRLNNRYIQYVKILSTECEMLHNFEVRLRGERPLWEALPGVTTPIILKPSAAKVDTATSFLDRPRW